MMRFLECVTTARRRVVRVALPFLCVGLFHAQVLGQITKDPTNGSSDTLTDATFNWNDDVTYYWDFSKTESNKVRGTHYDAWNITDLTGFTSGKKLTIVIDNVMGSSDFSETNGDDAQANGYLYLDVIKVSGGSGNLSDLDSANITFSGDHTSQGTWTALYGDNGMSLQYDAAYTAAPEPSTYFMVSGLLAMPLCRFFLRFRKDKKAA